MNPVRSLESWSPTTKAPYEKHRALRDLVHLGIV